MLARGSKQIARVLSRSLPRCSSVVSSGSLLGCKVQRRLLSGQRFTKSADPLLSQRMIPFLSSSDLIDYLEENNVPQQVLDRIQLDTANLERFTSVLMFLSEYNFAADKLVKLFTYKNANFILAQNAETMHGVAQALQSLDMSHDEVGKIVRNSSGVTFMGLCRREKPVEQIHALYKVLNAKFNFTNREISQLFLRQPRLLLRNAETVEKLSAAMIDLFSDKASEKLSPLAVSGMLWCSEENLRETFEFLTRVLFDGDEKQAANTLTRKAFSPILTASKERLHRTLECYERLWGLEKAKDLCRRQPLRLNSNPERFGDLCRVLRGLDLVPDKVLFEVSELANANPSGVEERGTWIRKHIGGASKMDSFPRLLASSVPKLEASMSALISLGVTLEHIRESPYVLLHSPTARVAPVHEFLRHAGMELESRNLIRLLNTMHSDRIRELSDLSQVEANRDRVLSMATTWPPKERMSHH